MITNNEQDPQSKTRAWRRVTSAAAFVTAASLPLATSCSFGINSYNTDISNVRCNGQQWGAALGKQALGTSNYVAFVLHEPHQAGLDVLAVKRTKDADHHHVVQVATEHLDGTRLTVTPPLADLPYGQPQTVGSGPEFDVHRAGAIWTVDQRVGSGLVTVEGHCPN